VSEVLSAGRGIKLDANVRRWLRNEVSKQKKLSIRQDSTVADAQIKMMIDEPMSMEDLTVYWLSQGVSCNKVYEYSGATRHQAWRIKVKYFGKTAQTIATTADENRKRLALSFALFDEGRSNVEVAVELGVGESAIAKHRKKWLAAGEEA
jgi:hypothetical protein